MIEVMITKVIYKYPHPNADNLEIAKVFDWDCVVGKDSLNVGDKVVYFPVDAILPAWLEEKLLGDSKIKLNNSRVRATKIRGFISQGLAIPAKVLDMDSIKDGNNVAEVLGVKKFEPPQHFTSSSQKNKAVKRHKNPYFHEYTSLLKLKFYPELFKEKEEVVITEKIHGSNFRAGWVKAEPFGIWQRFKKFLGLFPKQEFVYGSHRVQYQSKKYSGFYENNIYLEACEKYNLQKILPENYVVYGEIYGCGVQKNYTYGCKQGERRLIIFDVYNAKENKYLDFKDAYDFCARLGLPYVPILFSGEFKKEYVDTLVSGVSVLNTVSVLDSSQKVREGIVIRPVKEEHLPGIGRKIMKVINPDYLLDVSNTDFH